MIVTRISTMLLETEATLLLMMNDKLETDNINWIDDLQRKNLKYQISLSPPVLHM